MIAGAASIHHVNRSNGPIHDQAKTGSKRTRNQKRRRFMKKGWQKQSAPRQDPPGDARPGAALAYRMASTYTSNTSVAFPGISLPAPRSP